MKGKSFFVPFIYLDLVSMHYERFRTYVFQKLLEHKNFEKWFWKRLLSKFYEKHNQKDYEIRKLKIILHFVVYSPSDYHHFQQKLNAVYCELFLLSSHKMHKLVTFRKFSGTYYLVKLFSINLSVCMLSDMVFVLILQLLVNNYLPFLWN